MAWLLNVLLPGAGLIIRRREWLGFSLALVFGINGNVVLAGRLIAPAAIPAWLTLIATGLTCVSWVSAQVLLRRQNLLLAHRAEGVSVALREVTSALAYDDRAAARLALESGFAMDDENAELHMLRARLCEMEGDDDGMRAACHGVLKFGRDGPHGEQASRLLTRRGP